MAIKTKRLLALITTIAVFVSAFSLPISATTGEEDYIKIKTAADLLEIQNDYSGKYKLMNDIVLEEDFVPLGSVSTNEWFRGVLDGNGYTISNLNIVPTVKPDGTTYGGIFAYIGDGTVKNLTIENVSAEVGEFKYFELGAIAGHATRGTITNCSVVGEFEITTGKTYARVGGIVGTAANSTITDTISDVDITYSSEIPGAHLGGIAGDFTGDILACGNEGNITANTTEEGHGAIIGGIVAVTDVSTTSITNSINRGTLSVSTKATAIAGGIVGEGAAQTTVSNNLSLAPVSAQSSFHSGFYPDMEKIASGAIVGNFSGTGEANYYLAAANSKAAGIGSITAAVKTVAELREISKTNEYWCSAPDETATPWFITYHEHEFDGWTITEEPSCYKEGKKQQNCTWIGCDGVQNVGTSVDPTGNHDYKWVIDEPATCGKDGKKHEECQAEGCTTKRNENTVIKATGEHTWNSGSVTTKATCTKEGVKTYKCTKCTVGTKTESIKAIAHSYKTTTTAATTSKNGKIVKKCSKCGTTSSTTTIYAAKTVKLSTSTYSYNGKAKKPSVTVKDSKGKTISKSYYTVSYASGRKNIGKYKVTVKFKGNYSGTKTLYFKINPKKVSSLKVKAGKKQMTVSWKKDSKVKGYQIQYATNSKFTKGKKTVKISSYKTYKKTIKKLKAKKTYYVRVRSYKKVGSTTYYGAYTSYKKVKIK